MFLLMLISNRQLQSNLYRKTIVGTPLSVVGVEPPTKFSKRGVWQDLISGGVAIFT